MSLGSVAASLTARIISSGTRTEKTVTSARRAVRMLRRSSLSLSSSSRAYVRRCSPQTHHPFLVMSTARSMMHLSYLTPSSVRKRMRPIDRRHVVLYAWGRKRSNNLCAPVQSSSSRIVMRVPSYSTADRDDEYNVKTNNSSWSKTTKL
jgi:hypothetical protein